MQKQYECVEIHVIRYHNERNKSFAGGVTYDNTLQPDKFPLHKVFEGHRVGDVVVFQGKQYEIIGIL